MRVSALNLFGLIPGPFLPGFFNDYFFKNSLAARRKNLRFADDGRIFTRNKFRLALPETVL